MQNSININIKTGKMYTSYRGISSMHTFDNNRLLITIAQSIHPVFLAQFGKSSRELLNTFVFDKVACCDVIIPGRVSEIHLRVAIDVTKLQTKFQLDSVSVTMENVSIFVSNNISAS